MKTILPLLMFLALLPTAANQAHGEPTDQIRIGVFNVDATTPAGSPLAYDTATGVQTRLSCRGVVVAGAGKPIVLCAVDWLGIASGGQTAFRQALAAATGTEPSRVAVHTLHQHDAPRCDFDAGQVLQQYGISGVGFNPAHARSVVDNAAKAATEALKSAKVVTHVGAGAGVVEKVGSNRRILGPDGKVLYTRWTACRDAKLRAFPAGVIDPVLRSIVFYNGTQPVASLTYYATHPQSYYRTGLSSIDFPGIARQTRQKETGTPHIHFNGAGGNIGAGKWNDGSRENRPVLAARVAAGMKLAWEDAAKNRRKIDASTIAWTVQPVKLPVASHLKEDTLIAALKNKETLPADQWYAAKHLIWLRRCKAGDAIDIGCLRLGDIRVLHMPGELFVEYQLAAQKMAPQKFVAMAAYGDYAPGYIGTAIAYTQGGYETSDRASRVAPEVEGVLMQAMQKLLTQP